MMTADIRLGDCLDLLPDMDAESVDLIYLDPPFNTGRDFVQFDDRWNSQSEYLDFMAERLVELHRVLKPTGSLYLHCDPTASHYLKVLLDRIFGQRNFRNEIIWHRQGGRAKGNQHRRRKFGASTDTILFYTKTDDYPFSPYRPATEAELKSRFPKTDEHGERYGVVPHFCSPTLPPRPNLCYEWRGFSPPHSSGWRLSRARLDEEYAAGNIVVDGKRIERRAYLRDYKGLAVDNLWTDIDYAERKERTGWPTQKPLALLRRIIEASSNPGDLVLDPFCGSGTTGAAALELGRRFIGMDINAEAVELARRRCNTSLTIGDTK